MNFSNNWVTSGVHFDPAPIHAEESDEGAFHYDRSAWSTLFSSLDPPTCSDELWQAQPTQAFTVPASTEGAAPTEERMVQPIHASYTAHTTTSSSSLVAPSIFQVVSGRAVQLYTAENESLTYSTTADMSGQFFMNADQELTSYRRNTFHITGRLEMHSAANNVERPNPPYFVENLRPENKIHSFEVELTCHIHGEETLVELTKKPCLDQSDLRIVIPAESSSLSFHWRRLMFRTATQNNGRRAQLRKYFCLGITTRAILSNGDKVELQVVRSKHITVRGRNPAFYDDREKSHDVFFDDLDVSRRIVQATSMGQTVSVSDSISVPDNISSLRQNPAALHSLDPYGSSSPVSNEIEVLPEATQQGTAPLHSYTYVPITRAYWTPPVDILYRPHAAHHRVKSRAKRYFSELEDDT